MSTVTLPRWVLGLLLGTCAVCVVAVAFLLGRVTAPVPAAVASGVEAAGPSGNMGAIEGLIATQRSLETRLGQIVPPPSCREHHQRSVRLFGRAITLLERTRDAMTGQGASDLAGVAAEGRAIETEARALDALANDLRRAAGLAPVP